MKYSFCESVTASSISPWCIRPLTETGKHIGGGVDTPSLCGRVRPSGKTGLGGWDLAIDFDVYLARGGSRACKRCLDVLRAPPSPSEGPGRPGGPADGQKG